MLSSEARYTQGGYLAANPTWHAEDSAWKAAHILRMVRKHALHLRTVGEVGCGAGQVLAALHESMPDVKCTGFDIAEDAIQIARQSSVDIEFVVDDYLTTPGEFDLTLCIDVFEHIDDYLGFLRSLRTKASHAIFHIPLNLSVQTVLRSTPLSRARRKLGHIHYFTKDTALETLQYAGYRIIDWSYTAGSLELPKRSFGPTMLKWPRRILFRVAPDMTVRVLGGFSLLVLTGR